MDKEEKLTNWEISPLKEIFEIVRNYIKKICFDDKIIQGLICGNPAEAFTLKHPFFDKKGVRRIFRVTIKFDTPTKAEVIAEGLENFRESDGEIGVNQE